MMAPKSVEGFRSQCLFSLNENFLEGKEKAYQGREDDQPRPLLSA